MNNFMEQHNRDIENIKEYKSWLLGAALTLFLAYTMIWIFY